MGILQRLLRREVSSDGTWFCNVYKFHCELWHVMELGIMSHLRGQFQCFPRYLHYIQNYWASQFWGKHVIVSTKLMHAFFLHRIKDSRALKRKEHQNPNFPVPCSGIKYANIQPGNYFHLHSAVLWASWSVGPTFNYLICVRFNPTEIQNDTA